MAARAVTAIAAGRPGTGYAALSTSQGLTGSARAGAVRQSEVRGLVTAPATRRTMIGSGPRCTSSCEEDGVTLYTAAGGLGEQGQCHTLHAPVVWSVLLLRLAAVSAPAAPRAWSLIVFYSATKASQRVCLLAQRPPARPPDGADAADVVRQQAASACQWPGVVRRGAQGQARRAQVQVCMRRRRFHPPSRRATIGAWWLAPTREWL